MPLGISVMYWTVCPKVFALFLRSIGTCALCFDQSYVIHKQLKDDIWLEQMSSRARVQNLSERMLESAPMSKDTRLTFRVESNLKKSLETIAAQEGRSVAQICDAFLKASADAYKKHGSKYLQRYFSRLGKDESQK
jgi:hypothetical protein